MSDPVANVDIEDVLSSIRRLVSGDLEKHDGLSRGARDAERLVLTPSQRVDAADQAEAAPGAEASGRTTPESSGVTDAHLPEIEEPQAAAPDAWDDAGGDVSDAMPETTIERVTESLASEVAEERGDAVVPDMDGADADGFDDDDRDDAELDGIAAMFARHDTATPSAWEPDGDDEDAFAEGADAPALDWRDADRTGEDDGEEPDMSGPEHTGGTDRDTERATTFRHDWDAGASHEDGNAFAIEDEAVLDEEALRDLVAEIVREELMGTLGERITRNVRKLVRREIHRALNSQDFD